MTAASTTIQVGKLALVEAAAANHPSLASARVIKPLRRMMIGLVDVAHDVAPAPEYAGEPAYSRAADHLVGAATDLIDEAMRRAAQAARDAGEDPVEAVRKIRRAFECITHLCANQHSGEGQ